jgi:hypothetical protein
MRTPRHSTRAACAPVFLMAAVCVLSTLTSRAVPYATCLTNGGSSISFRLNESADEVKIIYNGGTTTNTLGARAAGLHTIALAVTGTYQVVVFKSAGPGFRSAVDANQAAVQQISTDATPLRFNSPRGIAINKNPASPFFGRVYVANGSAGTTTTGSRPAGDGIYLLNADLSDAVGQGNTARTGGLNFTIGLDVAPYRLSIGEDNNLYVCEWGDTNGSLYVVDPNVSDGSGLNVLGGPTGSGFPVGDTRYHGSIAAAVAEGSLAGGDLRVFVVDEDLQVSRTTTTQSQRNSVWRHDIGSLLPGPEAMPSLVVTAKWVNFASQTMDMTRIRGSSFYVSDYRSSGNEAGVWVCDGDGSVLWDSRTATRAFLNNATATDLLKATGGLDISADGSQLALVNYENNAVTVLTMAGGLPDLTNRLAFSAMGTASQGRDLAFDAAGNLYVLSSGSQIMRVFSPGGVTTATTGSDGTFGVVHPSVQVSITTSLSSVSEAGGQGLFTLMRYGGDISKSLTVNYQLSGTASNGVDYAQTPSSITFPANEAAASLYITAIDDSIAEMSETVVITLTGTPEYEPTPTNSTASATILDNEPTTLTLTATDTNLYEAHPTNTAMFVITRLGDLNTDIVQLQVIASGTATAGTDYQLPFPIDAMTMGPGVVTLNIRVTPLDDHNYEGDETVTLTLGPGAGEYVIGTPASATAVITDNEYAPAPALFSDAFETDSSASWVALFWANNGLSDATTLWAVDYSQWGIPTAPHTTNGTQRGLMVTVNKDTTPAAAAINLYPTGGSFSGNYALRFDLYVSAGNSNQTEHTLAGLNHSGTLTNAIRQSSSASTHYAGSDGVWVNIDGTASALRDYAFYTSTNPASVPALLATRTASSLSSVITRPPYGYVGAVGNASNSTTRTWAEVELSQVGNVVALKINQNLILQVTNTSPFTSGNIMLGYNDQFDSRGSDLNFVVFDNVEVVRLPDSGPISITRIEAAAGSPVRIYFDAPAGGQPADFTVQSSPTLVPLAWGNETAAVIEALSGTSYRATITTSASGGFYRIRK